MFSIRFDGGEKKYYFTLIFNPKNSGHTCAGLF